MDKKKYIDDLLENYKVPERKTKEAVWKEIDSKLSSSSSLTAQISPIRKYTAAIAAACVAIALIAFWPKPDSSFSTNLEFKEVKLPDGSTAELGPHSTLEYKELGDSRIVNLTGAAYFNVTKGKEFIVDGKNCDVKVLGTTFKVFDTENTFDVKCYSGSVQVKTKNTTTELKPGKGLNSYNMNTVYTHEQNYDDSRASLTYNNEFLNGVIADLNLKLNISIQNTTDNNPIISYDILEEDILIICQTIATISGLEVRQIDENSFEFY